MAQIHAPAAPRVQRAPPPGGVVNLIRWIGHVKSDEQKFFRAAVLVHGNGAAFEVEFTGYDGHSVALLTLERNPVRPRQRNDIPHARELVVA